MAKVIGLGNALVDIMTMIDSDKVLEKLNLPKGSMQLVERKNSVGDQKVPAQHGKRRLGSKYYSQPCQYGH